LNIELRKLVLGGNVNIEVNNLGVTEVECDVKFNQEQ